jgi:hypothetical protein
MHRDLDVLAQAVMAVYATAGSWALSSNKSGLSFYLVLSDLLLVVVLELESSAV